MRTPLIPLLFATLSLGLGGHAAGESPVAPRLGFPIDADWRFLLGDPRGAEASGFSDRSWRKVNVPHDWSIEGDFDAKAPTGAAGGFRQAGVGWYRRTFAAPAAWKDKRVTVEFEGVYMNAEVWINGKKVAEQPYGYTSFYADLTSELKYGSENVLAVRVDNSKQKNSRWYSGSGIYRHVWLTVTDLVHVAPAGVFVRTLDTSSSRARLQVDTEITNSDPSKPAKVAVRTTLLDANGKTAAQKVTSQTLAAGETANLEAELEVTSPKLWSPKTPTLYSAIVEVAVDGKLADAVKTPFGIRTLKWTVDKGLQLNGETIKLYGGCVHHDQGALGAASYDRAEERRVELLLAAGFNAVRTSHNPPSPSFLDACDRLGLLVMDEAFDCWNNGKNGEDYHVYFKDWWQRDLSAFVRRDRNHPSVIMWSIGNEIPERYTDLGADTAKKLADEVRRLDPTRPVTEGILFRPKPEEMAIFDRHCEALDIAGYNYAIGSHAEDHARVPGRVMVSTESNPRDAFSAWAVVNDTPYVVGDFMWSAIDYMGEGGIGRSVINGDAQGHGEDKLFPYHSAYCGDLDVIGERKPPSHYRNIVWDRGEKLYLAVQQPVHQGDKMEIGGWALYPTTESWTWPGFEGQTVKVEVYSRGDKVKLYQDGKLLGEQPTGRDQQFKAIFDVPYHPGALRAEAYKDGKKIDETELKTAGAPAAIKLTPDRAAMSTNPQDLIFVIAQVVDKDGTPCPNADNKLTFSVSGPAEIAGVGNGDAKSLESYQGNQRTAFEGRAQVILRATGKPGPIELRAQAAGLAPGTVALSAKPLR